ncbi:MAG: O-antigen ligase family protein, partial [Chloroflexota bacterium]
KWSFAPRPFTGTYVFGFVIVTLMLTTVVLWIAGECVGWRRLLTDKWIFGWWVCLGMLCLWSTLSYFWAYGLVDYAGLAETTTLQLITITLFLVLVRAITPSLHLLCGVLVITALLNGIVGGLQVWFQSDIGLTWLGEFSLNPALSGVSVLEANGERWLRPHGLLPHPNMLGGLLSLGVLASVPFVMRDGWQKWFGLVVGMANFWFLLLTFSRGGWLGFAIGALVGIFFIMREKHWLRRLAPLFVGMLIVGSVFVFLYAPFLQSRVGIGEQNTELRSIADRVVYNNIALEAIRQYPLTGVGAGNYPWFSAVYLVQNTDYDLNGNNVHNIYLGITAELGFVGMVFFVGMLLCMLGGFWQQRQHDTVDRAALLAGVIAWGVMGIFDHFMWTLVLTQTLWLALMVAVMSVPYDSGVAVGNGTGMRSDVGTDTQSPPVTTT